MPEDTFADADPTPEQLAMEKTSTKVSEIEVKVGSSKGPMPVHAKLAHVLAIVVSGAIALAVACVLADGMSVIKLKQIKQLPIITAKNMWDKGFKYRADELLGPTYGIGLMHDQSGRRWDEIGAGSTLSSLFDTLGVAAVQGAVPYVIMNDALKHPVPLLQCNDLKMAGMAAMGFGFIAESVAVVMIAFHSLVLAGLIPTKAAKVFAGLIWTTLSAGFLIVILLAVGVYTATWKCDNILIPEIKINEHFEYNYGIYFAIIGFISSLLVLATQVVFTSFLDGALKTSSSSTAKPGMGAVLKALCIVSVGCVLGGVLSVAVLGANDFGKFKEVDDTINPCDGQKPTHAGPGDNYFKNNNCMKDGIVQNLEQAGGNVTKGFKGLLDAKDRVPITEAYDQTDLCPVNVHWHLGAEHLSIGQHGFDCDPATDTNFNCGPNTTEDQHRRQLALSSSGYAEVRKGFQCRYYDKTDSKFTTAYNWEYCDKSMVVGETYEVHWPHSAAGACGTKWQYQTPFYDGVFCKDGVIEIAPLNTYKTIGVQAQIFTIVNDGLDEASPYYNGDLIKGMIVEGVKGADIAKYTGSTTGTSRDNTICSRYTPITWQVDRMCHMISAKSFDKLCKDMKAVKTNGGDDMKDDTHAHGARVLVDPKFTANNQQDRK